MNYLFAFLHGVVHPAMLTFAADSRSKYLLACVGIGAITLIEFVLLDGMGRVSFHTVTKPILSVTGGVLGYALLGSGRLEYLLAGMVAGTMVAVISYVFLSFLIQESNWGRLFPVMVACQLLAYALPLLSMMLFRKII